MGIVSLLTTPDGRPTSVRADTPPDRDLRAAVREVEDLARVLTADACELAAWLTADNATLEDAQPAALTLVGRLAWLRGHVEDLAAIATKAMPPA